MLVWIIKLGEPQPNQGGERLWRSGMLAQKMADKGHQVLLWNSTFSHQHKRFLFDKTTEVEYAQGIRLMLIHGIGYKKNASIRRYIDHRIIAYRFARVAQQQPLPDIIVSSIPDHHLAYETTRFANRHNIPIISDLRDLWPDLFLEVFPSFLKRLVKPLFYFEFQRLRFCFQNSTSLVAVSKSYLALAASRANRELNELDRYFYVGALPMKLKKELGVENKTKEFVYLGSFGRTYELNLVVDLAKHFFQEKIENVKFVIIGGGEQENLIKQAAAELPNLEYLGWLSLEEVQAYLPKAYAGLMPYVKGAPQCVPNKAFDYFSAGLPVISSLQNRDMIDLIEERNLGFNYEPGNKSELITQCMKLLDDHKNYQKKCADVADFYTKEGNADMIYNDYVAHIEKVLQVERNGRKHEAVASAK